VYETVTKLVHDSGPKDILCHGSVLEVPLAGSDTIAAPLASEDIRLYPTIKRAMADVAARSTSAAVGDYVEMLLQNLDSQKGSAAGILDLPGAAHALTFQSVPGPSRYYARLDIHPKLILGEAPIFQVAPSPFAQSRVGSGHWPALQARSAAIASAPSLELVDASLLAEPTPSTPQGPSEQDLLEWPAKVSAAFTSAQAGAVAAGTPIHPRLIHVQDYRKNARSAPLGPSRDDTGTDGAGWWLDVEDVVALIELLKVAYGATIHLPDADNLFEQPGPRWYRPWAPQVVLHGSNRSTKFGTGGWARADGFVNTRVSGEAAVGLAVGGLPAVYAQDAIADTGKLAVAGLPPETRSLFGESAMLDPGSAGTLARFALPRRATAAQLEAARLQFQTAARGLILRRAPAQAAAHNDLIAQKVLPFGELGAADGTILWNDPRDSLFLDVNYAHPWSHMETGWTLQEDHVEQTPLAAEATVPPPTQVAVFEERTPVTSTIANVLESALLSAESLNMKGEMTPAQSVPQGLSSDTFQKMDVITAPLRAFDEAVFATGRRERTGALRLNRLDLVDMFGGVRKWTSPAPVDSAAPDGDPAWPYWTELAPRLPCWSRLQFRLQAASNPALEASPLDPPVCGLLLPDFIEHAAEVFDAEGRALGQLTTDRARFGGAGDVLQVFFTLHPWVAQEKQIPDGGNPLDALDNPVLRLLVESLLAQSYTVPQDHTDADFAETGLTAMLRAIDTARSTLDPSVKVHDARVRLLGEPIAVMVARLGLEASTANPTALAQDPTPLLATPPALPGIPVRIGDVTRPDDGVLGAFLPGATPAEGRFAPVSAEARTNAVFNGLAQGIAFDFGQGLPIAHDFVAANEARFTVTAGEPQTVIVLSDVRGGLHATSGVLPRKKITLPKEFLDAAVARMEPTFRVGPLLTFSRQGALRPVVPPPSIDGHTAEFVHEEPGSQPGATVFAEAPVPPAMPVADLPMERVTLREGWIRITRQA
jgi:hypothetical protein